MHCVCAQISPRPRVDRRRMVRAHRVGPESHLLYSWTRCRTPLEAFSDNLRVEIRVDPPEARAGLCHPPTRATRQEGGPERVAQEAGTPLAVFTEISVSHPRGYQAAICSKRTLVVLVIVDSWQKLSPVQVRLTGGTRPHELP